MAFPTGYTKYQEVTIDQTKVSGTNTNFPALVDLSDMVKIGADIFDTCRTDGGDIRVTLVDGTTQLAREIVPGSFDKTAKTGEMWVKCPSLTDSVDLVVRVYYNGIDTEPAEDSTYGKENTWHSGYKMVQHMSQDPSGSSPQMIDSTSNDNDGTSAGSMTSGDLIDAQIAKGLKLNTNDYIAVSDNASLDITQSIALSLWVSLDVLNLGNIFAPHKYSAGTSQRSYRIFSSSSNELKFAVSSNGILNQSVVKTNAFAATDTLYYVVGVLDYVDGVNDDQLLYIDGVEVAATTWSGGIHAGTAELRLGRDESSNYANCLQDEVRVSDVAPSPDWVLTEYNNQNSPSTFYSVSDEQGGITQVETPVIAPTSGAYPSSQLITITCATVGADIYYTEDGSTPDATDVLYTVPFALSSAKTIKAIGIDGVLADSDVANEVYTIATIQNQPIITIQT